MNIDYKTLEAASRERLAATGVPELPVSVVVEHLLQNERLGKSSHGLFRLPGIVRAAESSDMAPDCVVVSGEGRSPLVEGGQLPGIYAMWFAVQKILESPTSESGVEVFGVRGYAGTTGSLGLYVWNVVQHGRVLLAVSNSEAAIAAPGGTNPLTGTNPIAFGFPSADGLPVIGDYASSVWAYGDIAVAGLRGEQLPEGVVLDDRGRPSTKPEDADAGSMLPSGGHRGFCQSLLVELLCGALVGGKIGKEATPSDAGLLVAFAPSVFGEGEVAVSRVKALKDQIESSSRIPGQAPPRSPGGRYAVLQDPPPESLDITDVVVERLRGVGVAV